MFRNLAFLFVLIFLGAASSSRTWAHYGALAPQGCPGHGQFYHDNFCWLSPGFGCDAVPASGGAASLRIIRGGKPTVSSKHGTSGLQCLAAQGVGLVIDLRSRAEDPLRLEQNTAQSLGMLYRNLPMSTEGRGKGAGRNRKAIVTALPLLQQFLSLHPQSQVFVHCAHGEDRTGLMIAAYRMIYEHTPRSVVWQEMLQNRYGGQADLQIVWRELDSLGRFIDWEKPFEGI